MIRRKSLALCCLALWVVSISPGCGSSKEVLIERVRSPQGDFDALLLEYEGGWREHELVRIRDVKSGETSDPVLEGEFQAEDGKRDLTAVWRSEGNLELSVAFGNVDSYHSAAIVGSGDKSRVVSCRLVCEHFSTDSPQAAAGNASDEQAHKGHLK